MLILPTPSGEDPKTIYEKHHKKGGREILSSIDKSIRPKSPDDFFSILKTRLKKIMKGDPP
jgi:hypothetical protein